MQKTPNNLNKRGLYFLVLILACSAAVSQTGLPYKIEPYNQDGNEIYVFDSDIRFFDNLGSNREIIVAAGGIDESAWSEEFASAIALRDSDWKFGSGPPTRSAPIAGEFESDFLLVEFAPHVEIIDIERPDAEWLRVRFRVVDIHDDIITIKSMKTKREQSFDAESLRDWHGRTMIFEGSRVRVMRSSQGGGNALGPSAESLSELIESVVVGDSVTPSAYFEEQQGSQEAREEAPCGEDSREPADHAWVGRMQPVLCTAFLLEGGFAATAGHCFRESKDQLVEFNVPASDRYGRMKRADAEDTYLVGSESVICSDCVAGQVFGSGEDWAIFRLTKNASGESVYERQGLGFRAAFATAELTNLQVYGYGFKSMPPEHRYVGQSSSGPFGELYRENGIEIIRHYVDTASGNSGSPILRLDSVTGDLYVIGIHNEGTCESDYNAPNLGASLSTRSLRDILTSDAVVPKKTDR